MCVAYSKRVRALVVARALEMNIERTHFKMRAGPCEAIIDTRSDHGTRRFISLRDSRLRVRWVWLWNPDTPRLSCHTDIATHFLGKLEVMQAAPKDGLHNLIPYHSSLKQ